MPLSRLVEYPDYGKVYEFMSDNFSQLYADFRGISISRIKNIILKCRYQCASMVRFVCVENFNNINIFQSEFHGWQFQRPRHQFGMALIDREVGKM